LKKIFFLLVIGMIASTARPQGGLTAILQSSHQVWTTPDGIDFIYDTAYSGGTLYSFAQKHFGNGERWPELLYLNPSLNDLGRTQVNNRGKKFTMLFVGEVIKIPYARSYPVDDGAVNPSPDVKPDSELWVWLKSNWGWVLCGFFIVAGIIGALVQLLFKRKDPITSGSPQVPGGVNDSQAQARVQRLAVERFGSNNILVKNIRRGRLNGDAKVYYANKPNGKLFRLKDQIGYAGEIIVDGKEKTVYFLQGCGNDVRRGDYMVNLKFTADAEIPLIPEPIVDQAPIVEKAPAAEANAEATAEVKDLKFVNETSHESKTESVTGSESHLQTMKLLDIAKDLIGNNQEKWKVEVSIKDGEARLITEFKKEAGKKESGN